MFNGGYRQMLCIQFSLRWLSKPFRKETLHLEQVMSHVWCLIDWWGSCILIVYSLIWNALSMLGALSPTWAIYVMGVCMHECL